MSLPGAQEDGTLNSSTSSYRDLNGATAYCSTTFPSLYFHKDISSPKYLFPEDLDAEHDRLVEKKREILEKEDTLVLSARMKDAPDKPVETVEISLKTGKILQCFGACNRFTEHHEEIKKLVNKHSYKFIRS